jgi:two-component system response regulator RegA
MTSLLIVDDDQTLCAALAKSLAARGHEIRTAPDVPQAIAIAQDFNPEWVLADLKMPGPSGLALVPALLAIDPATRIVILTGYASIATAVEAIKLGAAHYLTKPVAPDDIVAAFHKQAGDPSVPIIAEPLTLSAAERELIFSTYERHGGNISATARALGMHRRTLQRKLEKLK